MATEYMILHGGEQFGPYSTEQIAAMLREGNIDAGAMVWCEGWAEWAPVGKIIPPQMRQHAPAIRTATTMSTSQRKPQKKSVGNTPWIIAGAAVLLAIFIGVYEYAKKGTYQQQQIGDVAPAVVSPGKDAATADPNFSMSRKSDDGDNRSWWEIVNQANDSLIIKSVTFNGEFSAKRGKSALFRAIPDTEVPYPISIGHGETAYVMIFSPEGSNGGNYTKDITYVDLDTNRGKFRYRSGGLTPIPD